ncbi:ABC transporter A family member 7-like [Macadamia integrifolia]|uniref:ABC transporter A family member 7-like n=1 Tax=Macadamia integrifolia TaxID=60698 RepID=UPI001C531AC1|nr:ABC transporter A family member 7-like [Macadamia integrifolia]
MVESVSFQKQANALLRKNLCYQKRNLGMILKLLAFPIIMCILLSQIQRVINSFSDKLGAMSMCQCDCSTPEKITEKCNMECINRIVQSMNNMNICPVIKPRRWPPLFQLPEGLQKRCKKFESCPAQMLLTGANMTLGKGLARNLFPPNKYSASLFKEDRLRIAEDILLASDTGASKTNGFDMAFFQNTPLVTVQADCLPKSDLVLPTGELGRMRIPQKLGCLQAEQLWRSNSSLITTEVVDNFRNKSKNKLTNEILGVFDFLNTNNHNFNTTVWYNPTHTDDSSEVGTSPVNMTHIQKALNMASNSYLQFLRGTKSKVILEFISEMPKPLSVTPKLDISALAGPLFYAWIFQLLIPVMLNNLVYEKENKLRIMMKMHGLGDGSYWLITYSYFLIISTVYTILFILFATLVDLKSFTMNSYGIQFVFYFVYMNLQIALTFLIATFFSDLKTAAVFGFLFVFGSALLGSFLFVNMVKSSTHESLILLLEVFPPFALFRGLHEFGQYSFDAQLAGGVGMSWKDLRESGLQSVIIIMTIEWIVLLLLAYYLDQVVSVGSGVKKHPLWFLSRKFNTCSCTPLDDPHRKGFDVLVNMEKNDVYHEREVVEKLMQEPYKSYPMIVDKLQKVYPSRDGNPEKVAVKEISLALPEGECLGMLGPNGAGKTSFISMMIGLTTPTAGNAFVSGFDLRNEMDKVYCSMGVCPQHDLLWEMLTPREHLLFYGRLKNLTGDELTHAVEESLRGVNLFTVADKQAGKFSGGMKRRLSVAISVLGNPKVVYLDEPSTGLDPASRDSLWKVIKKAKQGKAIILTTHSMEEAEALCNRIGIFVDGSLRCIANPNELKARYGGIYILTVTTSSAHEEDVKEMVHRLSPDAKRIYHISGTQKFELPKQDVEIAHVFRAIENAKKNFIVQAWGLTDTTLEDVFIKVAKGAQN